ncbi:MAG: DUF1353 domain-containing protein [Proteobacteria bacterium]|nr:DUF1353 domain-containing protein [Pseudomonadota bacterium]MDA1356873.1 DUF1353 domain-containing protein [Pseudomonadota bacterium]
MSEWEPGADPFPQDKVEKITDLTYAGELSFVRHAKVHLDRPPNSLWQLAGDISATMTVHLENGTSYSVTVTAPRGLYTDLASVPQALWFVVGPIGKHLEISILHDYLYMAWTDHRAAAARQDWRFADKMFLTGLKESGVGLLKRNLMFAAVHSGIGWRVFKAKSYTLKQRMDDWLPHLDPGHDRES